MNNDKLNMIQSNSIIDIYTSDDIFLLSFRYKDVATTSVQFMGDIPLVELVSKHNETVTTLNLDDYHFVEDEKRLKLIIKNLEEMVNF